MYTMEYVNIFLEVFGSLLSLMIIAFMKFGKSIKNEMDNKFLLILYCNIIVLLSDATTRGFRGDLDSFSYIIMRIASFFLYVFVYILLVAFVNYLLAFISTKTTVSKKYQYPVWGISAVAILLVVISQFNDMFYVIDDCNIYRRHYLFWLSQVLGILCMLIDFWILVKYRKALNRQEFITFIAYMISPIVAISVQVFLCGVDLLYLSTTFAIVVMYIGVQIEQARLMQEKELELTQSRIAVMLSQIQPHFLYNTLTAICGLCDENPKEAKRVTADFSDYLRHNLESLNQANPIPFESELHHIEIYLGIEKIRFEDEMKIVYDIQTKDFMLPSLTVQPIIENAVKHNVGKDAGGGTVTLATREIADSFVVIVSDNGVGFNPGVIEEGGRQHIGMENVKNRLWAMCHATMEIKSVVGVGTTVTIKLPKEITRDEHYCNRR